MTPQSADDLLPEQRSAASVLLQAITDLQAERRAPSEEEKFGVFALFGRRGAGKTTIRRWLQYLVEHPELAAEELAHDLDQQGREDIVSALQGVLVCDALDASTISTDIPLGITIVEHLRACVHEQLRLVASEQTRDFGRKTFGASESQEERAWNELLDRYVTTDPRHRELALSLAVSPTEYRQIAADEVRCRGALADAIHTWVEAALAELAGAGKQCQALLVVLEDCDLAHGSFQTRWITTFLEELRDDRLRFLLIADDVNVEAIVLGQPEASGGPPQGRALGAIQLDLLAKLIPMTHRVFLEPWPRSAVLSFSLPTRPRLTGEGTKEECPIDTLQYRLHAALRVAGQPSVRAEFLEALLPRYPRGVVDLYLGLERLQNGRNARTTSTPEHCDDRGGQEVVALVARCRGNRQMARRLPLHRIDWWGSRVQWEQDSLKNLGWASLVGECKGHEPLWSMAMDSIPVGRWLEHYEDEDRVLWAEFFLNVHLGSRTGAMVGFLRRFTPVAERIRECQFVRRPTSIQLSAWAQESDSTLFSPWLRLRGTMAPEAIVEAGWSPLIDHSLGMDESTLHLILADLGVDRLASRQALGAQGLLPAELRGLILLVERMCNLPWAALGDRAQNLELRSWPHLLFMICGRVYVETILDFVDDSTVERLCTKLYGLEQLKTLRSGELAEAAADQAKVLRKVVSRMQQREQAGSARLVIAALQALVENVVAGKGEEPDSAGGSGKQRGLPRRQRGGR